MVSNIRHVCVLSRYCIDRQSRRDVHLTAQSVTSPLWRVWMTLTSNRKLSNFILASMYSAPFVDLNRTMIRKFKILCIVTDLTVRVPKNNSCSLWICFYLLFFWEYIVHNSIVANTQFRWCLVKTLRIKELMYKDIQ